jgi:hypothetical protein
MGYCKHQWDRRSDELREAFATAGERQGNDFFVCRVCLKIEEVRPEPATLEDTDIADQPAA